MADEPAKVVERTPSRWAHAFVFIVFCILGASFWVSTGTVISEFKDLDWPLIVAAHSHLFLFFPLFGTLALACYYYTPSVVLTDYYWSRSWWLKVRFVIGFLAIIASAIILAAQYAGEKRRAIWEISPDALRAERAMPRPTVAGCQEQRLGGLLRDVMTELNPGRNVDEGGKPCVRQPVIDTLRQLSLSTRERGRLSDFARSCIPDRHVEEAVEEKALRYCFPTGTLLTAKACCRAQAVFEQSVGDLATNVRTKSLTARVEEVAIAFKAFFVIVLSVVGLLLARWHKDIGRLYASKQQDIARGLVVGSAAMLIWPMMDYAYQLTSDVMFGKMFRGVPPRVTLWFSIALIALLLLNLFLYARRANGEMMSMSAVIPLIGTLATVIAYASYDIIASLAAWFMGVGLDAYKVAGVTLIALLGIPMMYGRFKLNIDLLIDNMAAPELRQERRADRAASKADQGAKAEPRGQPQPIGAMPDESVAKRGAGDW